MSRFVFEIYQSFSNIIYFPINDACPYADEIISNATLADRYDVKLLHIRFKLR